MSSNTSSTLPRSEDVAGKTVDAAAAADACMANMPTPTAQHAWLERFVGEWDFEMEAAMGPDGATSKSKGTDQARMIGGFWLVSEAANNDFPFRCVLTLGYDPRKAKYVGTFVDSMTGYLWQYLGTVDATGQTLSLETEGPSPVAEGQTTRFREVTEFKSDKERVFTSSMQLPDGNWVVGCTIRFRRKA